jgi:glutamine synthetase
VADLEQAVRDSGAAYVTCVGVDFLGIWRGKRMPAAQVAAATRGHGVPFSDVFWANTVAEDLIEPPPGYAGAFPIKTTGFPDHHLRLDASTYRVVPWLGGEGVVFGDWYAPDGSPHALCPRLCLKSVLKQFSDRGLLVKLGVEWEFYLIDQPLSEIADGGFGVDMRLNHTRPYTYHGLRIAQDRELLQSYVEPLEASGLVLESLNCETGSGQYELNLHYGEAQRTADNAFLMKQAVKTIAAGQGRTATFMAKPHETWSGNSGHLHLSLWSADGSENLFASGAPNSLNPLASQAVAGMLATMPAAMPFCCPNPNSYKRLVPYMWGSTTLTWGLENRTVGLRAIESGAGVNRIEHRLPGGDCNPYLAIAAALAGILHGIDAGLTAPPRYDGDAYADPALVTLPRDLGGALDALADDAVLRRYMGADIVDHFEICARAELDHHRTAVTEWERRRYLELT